MYVTIESEPTTNCVDFDSIFLALNSFFVWNLIGCYSELARDQMRNFRFANDVLSKHMQTMVKPSINGRRRREMSICSKLGPILLEMEFRIFVRVQKVTWDHLLASKAEIIQK